MEESNYTKIYTGNPITAQLIVANLNDIDIYPVVKDESESARLAGFGIIDPVQEIYVNNDELKLAKSIVANVLNSLEEE